MIRQTSNVPKNKIENPMFRTRNIDGKITPLTIISDLSQIPFHIRRYLDHDKLIKYFDNDPKLKARYLELVNKSDDWDDGDSQEYQDIQAKAFDDLDLKMHDRYTDMPKYAAEDWEAYIG
jgi:hypothetical protein